MTDSNDGNDTPTGSPTTPRLLTAIAGVVSAGVALGVGELGAGVLVGVPSPLAAVGAAVIDLAPPGSKDLVVSLFGTNDKLALTVLIGALVLMAGAAVGLLAERLAAVAYGIILAVVGVGLVAALRDPTASSTLVLLVAAVEGVAAIQVLSLLLTAARTRAAGTDPRPGAGAGTTGDAARRGFLLRAGALGGLAIVGGGVGRYLLERRAAELSTAGDAIPDVIDPVSPPPADASFAIDGITPVVMPNDRFYRIDTALITPAVDVAGWQLRVHGMVDREVTLSFAQLVELPIIERYVTIACVSNEVGGSLVGNAKWAGPRLMDVLDMAGIQPGATQIVPRSVDGWTAGFPTSWITDTPRDALIAVRMNDQPLPAEHGFPARLIVPGLYGYVSATKWLSDIELTTLEAFDAYWVPRGWAKEAPILTQSRIDVPRADATVAAGPVTVAGVAWAPDRGISNVEVSVDGGAWEAATLATELSASTWVQWKWTWQATPGDHVLEVRATDGTGAVQTAERTRPDPDGARGHHRVAVRVS